MIIEPVAIRGEDGCWRAGQTDDAWVDIVLLLGGQANVCLTPKAMPMTYTDHWTYHSFRAALDAVQAWDWPAEPEPTGWHRHKPSNRRREDGDPDRETVRA